MTIKIIKKADFCKGIKARDMKDGHAYIDESHNIFIGNSIRADNERIKGFSVCGSCIAWETDEESRYVEIDLDIIVK